MKERITVSIDKELLSWLDSNIDSKVFANRSHGFEFLIYDEKRLGSKEIESDEIIMNDDKNSSRENIPNEQIPHSNETLSQKKSYSDEKIAQHEIQTPMKNDQGRKEKNNED